MPYLYDVIICDIVLSGLDIDHFMWQVLREIREEEE